MVLRVLGDEVVLVVLGDLEKGQNLFVAPTCKKILFFWQKFELSTGVFLAILFYMSLYETIQDDTRLRQDDIETHKVSYK